ncbi:MAG TPA: ATP-binding protein, partial [Candidatus Faecalibacterium faecipullorum]|nr:ATP-binding protein [Candidatus Faecalibacterium faecipullorum]
EGLLFSVRNTSRPVELAGDAAPATTKPDPALHGFGLDNVRAILKKYGGDFAMQYAAGWFEFVGEVPARPAP